jgi:hypothetical protein
VIAAVLRRDEDSEMISALMRLCPLRPAGGWIRLQPDRSRLGAHHASEAARLIYQPVDDPDTVHLTGAPRYPPNWSGQGDYLRVLQRKGRQVAAQMGNTR